MCSARVYAVNGRVKFTKMPSEDQGGPASLGQISQNMCFAFVVIYVDFESLRQLFGREQCVRVRRSR
jgi:hypothetical protein